MYGQTTCQDATDSFTVPGLFKKRNKTITCDGDVKNYSNRACQFPSVKEKCPVTCNSCGNTGCRDVTVRFFIPGSIKPKTKRTCKWVSNKKTDRRCKLSVTSDMCPETCSACTYSPFLLKSDLVSAVNEYCNDPEAFAETSITCAGLEGCRRWKFFAPISVPIQW